MDNKIITFGEILLRLATPDHQRFSVGIVYALLPFLATDSASPRM